MRDVGEERGLRTVEFRQSLGPLFFLFVCPGVGNSDADLAGNQLEKPAILLVQP